MAVLTHEHEAQSQHDFASAVRGHCPPADLVANLHIGHIPYADRHAIPRFDNNVPNLFDVYRASDAVDQ